MPALRLRMSQLPGRSTWDGSAAPKASKRKGKDSGAGKLKESGVDGEVCAACTELISAEAIGAWLSGATSGAMCGAQVLESTVRGAET